LLCLPPGSRSCWRDGGGVDRGETPFLTAGFLKFRKGVPAD